MSVNSSTDVANLALDLLSAGTIEDIENPSNATEELLNRWYELTRQRLLRSHPWNFAAKRIILAASSTAPAFGYTKQFPVPADFMRILYLNDSRYEYEMARGSGSFQFEAGAILVNDNFTDDSTVKLVYVSDYTEVSSMDPMFVDLLAHELALRVAYKVTETNSNVERLNQLKEQAAKIAKSVDGQESPPIRIENSRSLYARRTGQGRNEHRTTF